MQHATPEPEQVRAYCSKCDRPTMHAMRGRRKAHCLEHQTPIRVKRPKPKQLDLFEQAS